ncbi:hypothetical protein [Salidesulfovibrio onnuriiensis]|uniref:hypothetical protein n=1 Tax=Salidesulfovibrio onnuriiensis TaxID=2583823 RepID=UPI0011C886D1|nr:hypothetical protein [Salidesulfovibrio onnuriiensis]
MKKLMLALAMVVMLCASASATVDCFNAKGSALVPSVISRYANDSQFLKTNMDISNITGTEVTCRVKVYDQNGDDVSSNGSVWIGNSIGGFTQLSTGNTFKIPAHSSRLFSFFTDGKSVNGYAVIEWTSADEDLRKALIAGSRIVGVSGQKCSSHVLINNGQPF